MRGSAAFRTSVTPGGALAGPWVRNPLWNAARSVPSLDLRFAENKSLVDATTGQNLVTFTRASSGTYVDSQGVIRTATTNEARFDHNPTTGESLGLLVEEQRTNLLLRSEEFNDASWTKIDATVSVNAETSPNGALLADKLITNNGVNAGYITQTLAFTSGTSYTVSCYAKAGEVSDFRFIFTAGAFGSNLNAIFNLTTGVVSSFTTGSASIQTLGNGWYRCSATATAIATASAPVQFRSNHLGNGTNGIYLWGAQLEAGSFPTSYIPTTTAAVTRSADVASITGSNFSSWYRQDEGTMFVETVFPTGAAVNTSSRTVIDSTDGTTNNRVNIRAIGGASTFDQLTIRSGGSTTAQFSSNGSAVSTASRKIAAVYKLDDFAMSATGASSVATDTSGAIPVGISQAIIGSTISSTEFLSGTITRLTYFPTRLANSTLQQITQ